MTRNRWVDFHGETRSNATHQSTTDPVARLCSLRKTCYRGLERVNFAGYLVDTAYNLVRLARPTPVPTLA